DTREMPTPIFLQRIQPHYAEYRRQTGERARALEAERQAKADSAAALRREIEAAGITVEGLIELIDIAERLPAVPIKGKLAGLDASGRIAGGRVGAAQLKPVAHQWRWSEISPYLDRIAEIALGAEISPIEFAERQQFLLTNPGLGRRLQVTSTMRCAVSIYNPGDVAPVHIHT